MRRSIGVAGNVRNLLRLLRDGSEAKGNGRVAEALKTPPTDLTALTKNNNGQFPDMRVQGTITGQVEFAAHGTRDMPVRGIGIHALVAGQPIRS